MESTAQLAPLAHRIPEACRRLGIGRSKFYELATAGEIKTFRIGSRVLVPESELVRIMGERLGMEPAQRDERKAVQA